VASASLPSYDELPASPGAPSGSSWGLWGPSDKFGCLNLLTAERVTAGVACAVRGAVFNLNLEMELPGPPLFARSAFEHVIHDFAVGHDDELVGWNTQSSSQWDGFRHRRESVGRPIDPSSPSVIEIADLMATLDAQGVEVEVGDILLVRTGWLTWYRSLGPTARVELADTPHTPACGLQRGVDSARALWNLHIAAIAADNPALEVMPFGFGDRDETRNWKDDPGQAAETMLHFSLLGLLGIPIGELFDLDGLAEDCASDGRYACLLTSAPLNLSAGVASPPYALAIK